MLRADDCLVMRYRSEMKESWDSCIAQAKNGSFLFKRAYMDYHSASFEDHSLLFSCNGRLIACLPAHRVDDALCSHRGLTFGGLIMHKDVRLSEVMTVFRSLLDHMNANGLRTLYYRHMPHPYHRLPAEEDLVALNSLGARLIEAKATCVVPAGRPALYSSTLRQTIRRSHAGAVLRQSFDFAGFISLCENYLWTRRGARPVHTADELEHLAAQFPENILLYTVERDSKIEGGLVIFRNNTCARSQYIAQSTFGRKAMIMPTIYDHILQNVLPAGTMFDFGHSTDPATGMNDQGIHWYKESFGARTILLSSYELSLV